MQPNFDKSHSIFHSWKICDALVQVVKVSFQEHVRQYWGIVMKGW